MLIINNISYFQLMEVGLNLRNGVPVTRHVVEDLRYEPEHALTQLLSTVVQSVWDLLLRHERVMKIFVQVTD